MKTMKNDSKMAKNLASYFDKIWCFSLDIFFPKRCVLCKKPADNFVCYNCINLVEKVKTSTCPDCGKISQFGKYCPSCKVKNKRKLTGILTSTMYESGPVKEMIHHLKYSGFKELISVLGELMVERLKREKLSANIIVVPVPLHQKREFFRGFNQSELLARYISDRLDLHGGLVLTRVKNTDPQVSLTGEMRRINLINAFRCADRELVEGKTVLLIDDVTTTGSTLNECAKILCDNGAKQVFGVVIAKRGRG